MRSNTAAVLSVIFALAVATACNCGWIRGSGAPCTTTAQCPASEYCVENVCTFSDVPIGDGGFNPGTDAGSDGGSDGGQNPCVGLECQQAKDCPASSPTRITGRVMDPSGLNPVYNALVYVPNAAVQPLADGVTCDVCNPASGNPLVLTTSKTDGTFQLDNMPVGSNIPLVIQVGKWRRQITLPAVTACQTTALATANATPEERTALLTRLPRNKSEGDMPKIAISTGNVDPFQCLLLRMGIDSSEFTGPGENGRVHWYRRNGAPLTDAGTHPDLVGSLTQLEKYDVVILPCTGSNPPGTGSCTTTGGPGGYGVCPDPDTNPSNDGAYQRNLVDYTSRGGRIFATHFSYEYAGVFGLTTSPSAMTPVANWNYDSPTPTTDGTGGGTNSYLIDTSFPKGRAFYSWLEGVGALDGGTAAIANDAGTLLITEPRHNVDSVNAAYAQRWMYGHNPQSANAPHVEHFTFNTPVDAGTTGQQCGRVVFSDFHVSSGAENTANPFPTRCIPGPLNPQEKALEFMLFDLSACVQADKPACGNTASAACSPLSPCCAGSGLTCVDSTGLTCQSPTGCSCQIILQ